MCRMLYFSTNDVSTGMTCIRNASSISSLGPGSMVSVPLWGFLTLPGTTLGSTVHSQAAINLPDSHLCSSLSIMSTFSMNSFYPSVVLFQPWGPYHCDPESHSGSFYSPSLLYIVWMDILDICNEIYCFRCPLQVLWILLLTFLWMSVALIYTVLLSFSCFWR